MNNWWFLLYLVGAGLMAWLAVRMVRNNPAAFSKENLGKSITTTGVLALIIIGVIAVCIILLRHL
ncbi:MAG TPA: hypothetical protein VD770_00115 [Coxiellaceae bacterium]|nr:hypothetical protein [Coxiellaceae bacterium]